MLPVLMELKVCYFLTWNMLGRSEGRMQVEVGMDTILNGRTKPKYIYTKHVASTGSMAA